MNRHLPLVACSLDASGQSARLAEWEELLRLADLRQQVPNGVRYTFAAPAIEERLRALAAAEKQCCSFFEFQIGRVGDRLEMIVTAPATYWQNPDGQETVRLFGR